MKKRLFAVLFACILLISLFCVGVGAQAEEKVVLDNSIFYIDIPEGYILDSSISENYYVEGHFESAISMEFYVGGNIFFPQGFNRLDDNLIIDRVRKITNWSTDFSVNTVNRGKINGQSAVIISGIDSFLGETELCFYVFATKEYYCVIEADYMDEDEKKELEEIVSTFVLNGTQLDGSKPINGHDFSNSPDYVDEIIEYTQDFYVSNEAFDDGLGVGVVIVLLAIISIPGVLIALIISIIQCVKYKKLVKEFEGYFGPIYAVRNNIMAQRAGQISNPQPQQSYYPLQQNPYMVQGNSQQGYAQPYPPQPTQAPASQQPVDWQGASPQPTGKPDDKI